MGMRTSPADSASSLIAFLPSRLTASDRRLMASHLTPREVGDLTNAALRFASAIDTSSSRPESEWRLDVFFETKRQFAEKVIALRDVAAQRAAQ